MWVYLGNSYVSFREIEHGLSYNAQIRYQGLDSLRFMRQWSQSRLAAADMLADSCPLSIEIMYTALTDIVVC